MCVRVSDQWKNREAPSSAHCTTDGLGVLAALVCTREDSMEQKAKNSEGHVTLGQCADKKCVCVCV